MSDHEAPNGEEQPSLDGASLLVEYDDYVLADISDLSSTYDVPDDIRFASLARRYNDNLQRVLDLRAFHHTGVLDIRCWD